MQFRIQNAFFPCNCHFYEQFLTDPPIKWDYGYYISINPKTWSHTLPKLKLPRNDPENAMQGEHINLFSYKTNVITLISGIKHQICLCQMCLTMFLQKDRKESVYIAWCFCSTCMSWWSLIAEGFSWASWRRTMMWAMWVLSSNSSSSSLLPKTLTPFTSTSLKQRPTSSEQEHY